MRETSACSLCAVIIVCFALTSSGAAISLLDSANSGWQTAALIENNDSESALHPQVAVDGSGNAVAVWQQYDGIRSNIWSNRFAVGAGWGEATLIEINDSGDAINPQIAIDNSGNATAVWQQNNGTRYCIYSNRYVIGIGWGSATLIESLDSEGAFNPQVALDDSGNAMVVWRQDDGDFDSIYSNRYVVGTGWGSATLIGVAGNWLEDHARNPQVAVDSSGNAVAVWVQYGSVLLPNLWSNRYVTGIGWGTAALIDTNASVDFVANPQVAVGNSGNAMVVWRGSDGYRTGICSSQYAVGEGWGNMTFVEADDVRLNASPHVAADGSGNAMVVWRQIEGTSTSIVESGIKANRYVAGIGWQTATILEDCSSGLCGGPRVAVNDWGDAVAVWMRSDGSRISICSSLFDVETGWVPTASFGTGDPLGIGNPQVAIDNSGNAIVVWWQYDGTVHDIWSNRYVNPDTSSSSPLTSVNAVLAILAVVVSVTVISFFWLRKRKGDRSGESVEDRPTN